MTIRTVFVLFLAAALSATLVSCSPQGPGAPADPPPQADSSPQSASSDSAAETANQEFRILTWNLEWFNDHDVSDDQSTIGRDAAAPSAQEFQERVQAFGESIAAMKPTIAALQEVENGTVVLALADELQKAHGLNYNVAFIEGRDSHTGQDVAFLVEDGLSYDVERFDFRPFRGRSEFKSLSKHLRLDVRLGGEDVTLVNVHLITRPGDRQKQARMLRTWIEDFVTDRHVVILGDCNTRIAFQETTPDSDMGILRGFGTPQTDDDLWDTQERMGDRSTHVAGHPLDRILLSASLHDDRGLDFASIKTRRDLAIRGKDDFSRDGVDYSKPPAEQDLSDHYPLLAVLNMR